MTDDDDVLTVREFLDEIGLSRTYWQKMKKAGQTPPLIQFGTAIRIRRGAGRAWLRGREA